MAMTAAEYEAFVLKLNESAIRNPSAYKSKVILLALLGYMYVGFMSLIVLVLAIVAVVSIVYLKWLGIKIAIGLFIFLYFIAKAMFVNMPPPGGRRLEMRESPALFETIDKLRRRLRAPRFHEVVITNDFNAAVVQVPQLGIFGWYRNYLLLGLPLLKSMTVEQFEAVLAHEFGHLAGGHAALSNWIYRLRIGWQRLVGLLEYNRSWGSFLFRPFFNWYAPYFAGYSFPLARLNEYEADNASSRLTSPLAAAEALTAVNVIGRYLNLKFWPGIHKQAEEVPQPAFAPYSKIGDNLSHELASTLAKDWLDQSMQEETGIADTHPSLKDRLRALGQEPVLAPPAPGKGADLLLGSALDEITLELDRQWSDAIAPAWQKRYEEVQQGRKQLEELTRDRDSRELTHDEMFALATLTESFGADADAALEQLRALHALAPDRVLFGFALGMRLLRRDDPAGIALVEDAIRRDEDAVAPGCEALRDFHWRNGDKENAHRWHDNMLERHAVLNAAQLERANIASSDKFAAHDLPPEAIANLQTQLAGIPELRKVYLVRKEVRHLPDRPLYICAFTITSPWRRHNAKKAAAIQQKIVETVRFPGETFILNAEGKNSAFESKLGKVREAQII